MKQKQLKAYQPNYPKKWMRSATLATAALLALGTTTGCKAIVQNITDLSGAVAIDEPAPTELVLDGEVAIDEPELDGYVAPETPEPEELRTEGIVPIEEQPTEEPEEVMLLGDVAIVEP